VGLTNVPALATRATPMTGKAVSAANAEAWCAKALPKQDKQTRHHRRPDGWLTDRELSAALNMC
jgi:hypothetical protein